jgi:uncharacterized membrane protein
VIATRPRSARRWLLLPAAALLALAPLAAPVAAVDIVSVTTPYPAVVAAPGSKVSFSIDISTAQPGRVDLSLSGVPDGWTASLHGGGVVDSVLTTADTPTNVRLDVEVPADAATGTTRITVKATSSGSAIDLPLDLRIDAASAGDVTLKTDFPALQGPSDTTFSFNLTLSNGTAEDLTFAVNAVGPSGWDVTSKLTGSAQAASAIVTAGGTSGVSVSVVPPTDVAAGDYTIDVQATAGAQQIPLQLGVQITGSYTLTLTTPDQRLNGHGSAGSATEQDLTVTNTGTAELTDVAVTATAPTGWTAVVDQPSIASIAPNATASVKVTITPSGDAIAGDYALTFRASNQQANDSIDYRFTVETSQLWFIVGIALIVAVGAGLWWVFQRYGRR